MGIIVAIDVEVEGNKGIDPTILANNVCTQETTSSTHGESQYIDNLSLLLNLCCGEGLISGGFDIISLDRCMEPSNKFVGTKKCQKVLKWREYKVRLVV